MTELPEATRTLSLRVIPGGSDLAARVSVDFDEKLFRRNYRRPVLVSTSVVSEAAESARWAEAGAWGLLGQDVASRALNRIAAEAAEPLVMHAMIRHRDETLRRAIYRGISDACVEAECVLVDDLSPGIGEEPMVAVSATGVVERRWMMDRGRFEDGDTVLAVGSDRLWPDTLAAAQSALGKVKGEGRLGKLRYGRDTALLRPVPSVSSAVQSALRRYTVKRVAHAMTPVEGDGLERAMERLIGGAMEVKPGRGRKQYSPLLGLLEDVGDGGFDAPEADEGHRRGIGYLMVVGQAFANAIAQRMRRQGVVVYAFGRLAARKA